MKGDVIAAAPAGAKPALAPAPAVTSTSRLSPSHAVTPRGGSSITASATVMAFHPAAGAAAGPWAPGPAATYPF